jgi:uncharacterized protein YlxW (UPF0749 family)
MKTRASQLSITLVALMLGVLVMAQFATQQHMSQKRALASGVDGALLISSLVEGNARLRQEVNDLDAQMDSYRSATNQSKLQAMQDELDRLKVFNGAVQVYGLGVQVTLDGPVAVLDLQDLLNELRNAGAEALALNGQRLIASSIIEPMADGSIIMDGVAVRRPYVFTALGDPATLETALLRPGGLLTVFSNSRQGLMVSVQQRDRLTMPIYTTKSAFQYAVPVK